MKLRHLQRKEDPKDNLYTIQMTQSELTRLIEAMEQKPIAYAGLTKILTLFLMRGRRD